ncbi:hypothetical protein E5358_12685 [Palleniella muris]|uniref:Uncharacterized protein n=1 Tax=Palleniella muris TaxID=3038145 RepID=A0AC61QNS6_9BACT|nr:hypothetical protein [Palleniella muris]TGX80506.1 hypothetical protein E5358_12685 [Palleniella muris]
MAKKSERQELLQLYRELMTDKHMIVRNEGRREIIIYSMTKPDGKTLSISYANREDLRGWREPTPESIVEKLLKKSRQHATTKRKLEKSSLATQKEMAWIGEHRALIPYLLEYAETKDTEYCCFRDFICKTRLNNGMGFGAWWRKIVGIGTWQLKWRTSQQSEIFRKRKLPEFNRHTILCLPLAWLPKEHTETKH